MYGHTPVLSDLCLLRTVFRVYTSFINEPSEIRVYDLWCHIDVQPEALLLLQWSGMWLGGFFNHCLSSEMGISTHAIVEHDCTWSPQLFCETHGRNLLITIHLACWCFGGRSCACKQKAGAPIRHRNMGTCWHSGNLYFDGIKGDNQLLFISLIHHGTESLWYPFLLKYIYIYYCILN